MKEFVLLFRTDFSALPYKTPEELAAWNEQWMQWIGGIAAEGKLAAGGNQLTDSGRVVSGGNMVTNGPYMEIKESIGGYFIVNGTDYEDAVNIARGCPILSVGGNVEVREVSKR